MPIMTAYCRYRENLPESANTAIAVHGFDELGMEIIPYYGFGDVETLDCGPEALVCGFVGDMQKAMLKMGLELPVLDYPAELSPYYGRQMWEGPLSEVHDQSRVFIKPKEQKLFTGFLWTCHYTQRYRLAPYPYDTPCWYADPVTFVSEYRTYILDGELLGVKHYRGDWAVRPDPETVEAALRAFRGPRGFAIDFGVTQEGQTLVVEVNDGHSLGNYGLPAMPYARLLEARWEELTSPLVSSS